MRIQRNTVKLTGILVLLGMIGMQDSCIEEYIPDIEAGESRKYVVSGQLTTEREEQVISVALASSIRHPGPVPLNDCTVRIADENGNSFAGTEFEGGKYRIRIPRGNLIAGLSYRLEITTPAGARLSRYRFCLFHQGEPAHERSGGFHRGYPVLSGPGRKGL
jgi:hypothetical protein